MERKLLRVSLALERETRPEQVLAALEEALGHPIRPVRRVKTANVLVLRLTASELETARSVPGVRGAREEQKAELPPPPRAEHMER